ncbi:SDR family NAD(P)-dependent oxidoreductase [Bdellovibrio sp. HCB209]|uniref:SDR family NAD(P)-dependent oxidoreductase n=1 Tax=Bdellovibrio sp. HCB209 TaxID=3394354 RepID=UPI0039B69732
MGIKLGMAVVTGASSGIGAVYADRLAKRGYDVLLVARDVARLEELADKIRTETGRLAEVFQADLTKTADVLRLETRIAADTNINMVINNAGASVSKPITEVSADQIDSLIQLNITALTRLSAAAIKNFLNKKSGTLINISSVLALAPELMGGVYSASKAYVLNFTQALDKQYANQGIKIQVVLPGMTRTEIWDRSGLGINYLPQEQVMEAGDMVDAALVGLDNGEVVTIPTLSEIAGWINLDQARLALGPNLSRALPAQRYRK